MGMQLLGGYDAQQFLRRHWQKRPLLVRRAWRPGPDLPGVAALFRLAARDDVESRWVVRHGARWRVAQGPFARPRLRELPARNWTLLVNGVNHHLPCVERLLRGFSFLPQARVDDVMVSFAAPGGGVGPHDDSYDVFLLQGPGRRVWRLQRPGRFTRVADSPLRQIADFVPEDEYLLEPGDLLYLPPGWGHDGVALESCWTYSVGCRAPRGAELALALLDHLQERGLPDAVYRDPQLRPATHAAHIGAPLAEFARRTLQRVRWGPRDVTRVLGRHLTTPKPHVVFRARQRMPALAVFRRRLRHSRVVADARSLLLYRGAQFFVNGEMLSIPGAQRRPLQRFADRRGAPGTELERAGLAPLLYDWYRWGYVHLERGER